LLWSGNTNLKVPHHRLHFWRTLEFSHSVQQIFFSLLSLYTHILGLSKG
jgi:hypothetical protein